MGERTSGKSRGLKSDGERTRINLARKNRRMREDIDRFKSCRYLFYKSEEINEIHRRIAGLTSQLRESKKDEEKSRQELRNQMGIGKMGSFDVVAGMENQCGTDDIQRGTEKENEIEQLMEENQALQEEMASLEPYDTHFWKTERTRDLERQIAELASQQQEMTEDFNLLRRAHLHGENLNAARYNICAPHSDERGYEIRDEDENAGGFPDSDKMDAEMEGDAKTNYPTGEDDPYSQIGELRSDEEGGNA